MQQLSSLKVLLLIGGLTFASFAMSSDLVLVVHLNNPTSTLSRSQVIDLYMGKFVAFPDGSKATPVDIENDLETRAEFYESLVGMPLARVNAYWSKVKFSGRARPPIQKKNEQAILDFIMETENAIAYIHKDKVTSDVKVVYRLNE